MNIAAKYEQGVFKPLEQVNMKEGTLVEVRVPPYTGTLPANSAPVRNSSFYGLWKDRDDIVDSVEFVNNLRSKLRG